MHTVPLFQEIFYLEAPNMTRFLKNFMTLFSNAKIHRKTSREGRKPSRAYSHPDPRFFALVTKKFYIKWG